MRPDAAVSTPPHAKIYNETSYNLESNTISKDRSEIKCSLKGVSLKLTTFLRFDKIKKWYRQERSVTWCSLLNAHWHIKHTIHSNSKHGKTKY